MSRLSVAELAILLIEPSQTQRRIISNQLVSAGALNVEAVSGPEEAWISLKQAAPDLVISSMYFGGSTGSDFVRRMRSDPDLETTPFILISSESKWESLDPVKQAGVMAILPKPFDVKDLTIALEAVAEISADDYLDSGLDTDAIRVLVVDDSLTSRKHIIKLLEKIGLEQVESANDGTEAVELLESSVFDLVITDYNMPEMDGQKLTEHIRQRSDQSSIPILMITSEADESRLDAVYKSGVSAICDKPFDQAHIRGLINQMMS
ncbi:MAG: response regulator [Pseudomonadales bacterium]|nr:response regulator [Pseudomonadales bacterium]